MNPGDLCGATLKFERNISQLLSLIREVTGLHNMLTRRSDKSVHFNSCATSTAASFVFGLDPAERVAKDEIETLPCNADLTSMLQYT